MKLDIEKFKEILKICTCNGLIETVQINVDKNEIFSNMTNDSKNIFVILKQKNDLIESDTEFNFEFNFSNMESYLIPIISSFDGSVDFKIFKNSMSLVSGKNKASINFCHPAIVTVSNISMEKSNVLYDLSMNYDDTLKDIWNKIKKIGSKFGKIYFEIKDNEFFIEATDKSQTLDNSVSFKLGESYSKNKFMCFSFDIVSNIIQLIDIKQYVLRFKFAENNMGIIKFESIDKSIQIYIFSKNDG